ncbi:DUF3592 domain-containing protein [Couchioplanes azureus]|uniref:DUF3592 domain-containing protein n=1 Tax=Couchioplanes caeruleus TaxID=56438 RepID=UPI00167019E9|nr:DUF3592 domain-containing protein [Couchioplanes caeruleus]GGQ84898.1 hypothetical protein GCM10010166_63930 [Couchioplanes caeruleus subsp. azureus]
MSLDDRDKALLGGGLIVLVSALVGVLTLLLGIRRWLRARRLLAHGTAVTAVVVDNKQRTSGENGTRFVPVVRFHTREGQEVRTALEDLAGRRSHVTGTEYTIFYDPRHPSRAAVPGRQHGPLAKSVVSGLVLLGFSFFVYRVLRSILEANPGP